MSFPMGELEFSYKETAVLLLGNCLFATGQKEENSNILSLVAKIKPNRGMYRLRTTMHEPPLQ